MAFTIASSGCMLVVFMMVASSYLLSASMVYATTADDKFVNIGWKAYNTSRMDAVNATCDHNSILLDGVLTVFGGYNDNLNGWYSNPQIVNINLNVKVPTFNVSTSSVMPYARSAAAMSYSAQKQMFYLTGGFNREISGVAGLNKHLDDLWTYSIRDDRWTKNHTHTWFLTHPNNPPGLLWANSLTVTINGVEFGLFEGGESSLDGVVGSSLDRDNGEMWLLNYNTLTWTNLTGLSRLASGADYATPADGARMAIDPDTNTIYRFGGYICLVNGASTRSGQQCYTNFFFKLNPSTWTWTKINLPVSGDSDFSMVPSNRAYHTSAVHKSRFFVVGGAIQDLAGNWIYYNDIYAYNILSGKWMTINVKGDPMSIRWSHTMHVMNNALVIYAGCAGSLFYNSLHAILLDVSVGFQNFFVYGTGVSQASAGNETSFFVAIRNSVNSTVNGVTTYTWGEQIEWASTLPFSVDLIGSSSLDSRDVQLSKGVSTPLGNGNYKVTYTVTSGTSYKLFVRYDNQEVPNSPFKVTVLPSVVASNRVLPYGNAIKSVVHDQLSTFFVLLRDTYFNPISADSGHVSRISLQVDGVAIPSTVTVVFSFEQQKNVLQVVYVAPAKSGFSLRVFWETREVGAYSVTGFESVEVGDKSRTAVLAFAIVNLVLWVGCCIGLLIYWQHPVMKASSTTFMSVVLFGAGLVIAGVIIRSMPASDSVCVSSPWLVGVGFLLATTCLFVKSWRISKIFNNDSLTPIRIKDTDLFQPIVALVLIECIIHAVRLGTDSPHLSTKSLSSNAILTYQTCTSDPAWSYALYGFKAVTTLYGVYVAFLSRNVPSLFNESQVVSVVTFNIGFVALIALAVGFALESNGPTPVYVLEMFAILWCVAASLVLLFISKFYFIRQDVQVVIKASSNNSSTLSGGNDLASQNAELKTQIAHLRDKIAKLEKADEHRSVSNTVIEVVTLTSKS